MKKILPTLSIALLLSACSPFNTVQLYRYDTAFQTFMDDREVCVSQARDCIAERYKGKFYYGDSVEKLLPSRGVYMSCMTAKGYFPIRSTGFTPPVLVKMNDYEPGRDCFGR